MRVHVHAVALGHPFEQHPHVELAHAIEDRFVQRGVMLDANAGIFGGELVEGIGEVLFVAPALGLYGDTMHRRGEGDGAEVVLIFVVGVVEDRVEAQVLHFRDAADVAWDALGTSAVSFPSIL